jgi:hypothetical protein
MNRGGKNDRNTLKSRSFFFPTLFIRSPLGIMRDMDTMLAKERTSPISTSEAFRLSK